MSFYSSRRIPINPSILFLFSFIINTALISGDIQFGIIATSTLMPPCIDSTTAYVLAAKRRYGINYNITCIQGEIAVQVAAIASTSVDSPALIFKSSTGATYSPADIEAVTMFFLRAGLYTSEQQAFSKTFISHTMIINGAMIGYNIPELQTIDEPLRLTQEQLVGIFTGTIKSWDDPIFYSSNPKFATIFTGTPGSKIIRLGLRFDRYLATNILTMGLARMDRTGKCLQMFGMELQDGTQLSNILVNNFSMKREEIFLSSANLGISLYGFLGTTKYAVTVVPQEDVEKYGIRTALIQNNHGSFVTLNQSSIEDAFVAFFADRSNADAWLSGAGTYPLMVPSSMGFLLSKLGQPNNLIDCEIMAATLRFMNWLLDPDEPMPQQILANYYFYKAKVEWYTDYFTNQAKRRCGPQRKLVQGYIDSQQVAEDLMDTMREGKTWGIIIGCLLIGFFLVSSLGNKVYTYLNRLRRENMEQYAISGKQIAITPTMHSPVDRYKGVLASRKVVDRYIPAASLQCISTGTWGEYEVFLRPCSLVLHRLNHSSRMRILELMEISEHKNVVHFYGLTELPGGRCLVCNFCPFGDLRTLIISKKHIFSMNTKFSLAGDIAEGMEHLHDCGVVHGNLRSCAVFVEANWTAKVSDFEYDALHQTQGSFHPTVAQLKQKLNLYQQTSLYPWLYWTAPEILRQGITGREIPPKQSADIFSFGIVCSEIFSMESAYQKYQELPYKLTPAQILNGILSADMRPREEWKTTPTPRCVLRVMELCWQENSRNRPAFSTLRKLFRSVRSLQRHVADKIMIAAEKTAEAVKHRSETASVKLSRLDEDFHKYSRILVPPAYWRSVYKHKLYMSITRHELGIVFYCNLVSYGRLINSQRTARAIECINLLHRGFQNLIEKSGRVYRVYRNGTGFIALGNVPYGVKEDPIDSIALLAFDFMTWAWRVKVPANLMDGFQLQIGIHSGPLTAGTLKNSTNQFIPLGVIQKEAWNIVRSSAPCRILISEEFHQNLRQLAQIFIKYRIVPNSTKVFGYNKNTYWLVGMNYYRGQSLLDDIFLLDPENLEAAARLAKQLASQKKERKGVLMNELVKVVSALPFDYQALTAGETQYVVDLTTERERKKSQLPRPSLIPASQTETDTDSYDPNFKVAYTMRTNGGTKTQRTRATIRSNPDEVPSKEDVANFEIESPEAVAQAIESEAIKKLRVLQKKELQEVEQKREEQAALVHLQHVGMEAITEVHLDNEQALNEILVTYSHENNEKPRIVLEQTESTSTTESVVNELSQRPHQHISATELLEDESRSETVSVERLQAYQLEVTELEKQKLAKKLLSEKKGSVFNSTAAPMITDEYGGPSSVPDPGLLQHQLATVIQHVPEVLAHALQLPPHVDKPAAKQSANYVADETEDDSEPSKKKKEKKRKKSKNKRHPTNPDAN